MYQGSCLCGSIMFEIKSTFRFLGHCHCLICRKSHGASFATQGLIGPEDFAVTKGEDKLSSFTSSSNYQRFWCQVCGARLFNAPKDRSFFSVAINVLSGEPLLQPNFHTFVRSKAPWVHLDDEYPKFLEMPPVSVS